MNPRLPPWQIFKKVLSVGWEKRAFAIQISLPFVILVGLLGFAGDIGLFQNTPASDASGGHGSSQNRSSFWIGFAATFALTMFLFSVIAVYWHRNILLHETTLPKIPVRFDAVVWRYLAYGIGISITYFGFVFTVSFGFGLLLRVAKAAFGLPEVFNIILVIALIVFFLWAIVALFRLSLVLPAAAIGHKGFGFGAAWHISRGNGWQILTLNVLGLIFYVILALISKAFTKLVEITVGAVPGVVTTTEELLLKLISLLVGLGLLSLTYAYLTYEAPESEPEKVE